MQVPEPRHGTGSDAGEVSIQSIHTRAFTGDNFHHCAIEFVALTDRDVG